MKKRILWMAQNEPMPEQRAAIERVYPDADVIVDLHEARNTEDVVTRIRAGRYDDVVAVMSWSILSQLTQRGIYPIYAKVSRSKGKLVHMGLFRCRAVHIDLDDLEPLDTAAA